MWSDICHDSVSSLENPINSSEKNDDFRILTAGRKMAGKEGEGSAKPVTVEISKLRFTYPGIDGHPPPGSTPLIDDFSLTLHSGDRCLLVGSNGAGTFFSVNSNCKNEMN